MNKPLPETLVPTPAPTMTADYMQQWVAAELAKGRQSFDVLSETYIAFNGLVRWLAETESLSALEKGAALPLMVADLQAARAMCVRRRKRASSPPAQKEVA